MWYSKMRLTRRTLIWLSLVASIMGITTTSAFAVSVGSSTDAIEAGGSDTQNSAMVLTAVGNSISVPYPFGGTKTAVDATNVVTLDGGGGASIYTLPSHNGAPLRDYFEFTLESPNASTAFVSGKLSMRWLVGTNENTADITLAAGDTDGTNLDGATFLLEWPQSVGTGDTVLVVYEETFTDGPSVTVSRQSLSFTTP